MRVDVSEIKTFRGCKRQWELSSRNRFHLQSFVTPKAFAMGTLFHESLHALYLGASIDKVMEMVKKEMDPDNDLALLAMIPGYAREVLPEDLEMYQILDVEHKFSIPVTEDLEICGSIDMIALNVLDNKIYGFEHKTAKNFRDETFLWMDDQPRVYTVALIQYLKKYNEKHPGNAAELGGIYINEVKKLLRQFQYKRTLCTYDQDDLYNYFNSFVSECRSCKAYVDSDRLASPSPSYFGCQNCEFKTICATYQYKKLDKREILDEFEFEFKERDQDHLDEKVERNVC